MARGRLLKTKVREAKAVAKAEWTGILEAFEKAGEPDTVRDTLQDIASKIDPLEIVAVVGITSIIKQGIEWTEIPMENISSFAWLIGILAKMAGIPDLDERIKEALDSPQAEFMEWMASFAAAFLIVRHFGEIVQAGTNILSLAKSLLIAPVVMA